MTRTRGILIGGCVLLVGGALVWANAPLANPLPADAAADRVVVEKAARRLMLMQGDRILKSYGVSLGGAPEGHKRQEGDERTPEGSYLLDSRKEDSIAHLALHVSYPDSADVRQAAEREVSPGGRIMVHGIVNGLGWLGRLHRLYDWTDGCIAVTNPEIEEIWRAVPVGTPIEIRP